MAIFDSQDSLDSCTLTHVLIVMVSYKLLGTVLDRTYPALALPRVKGGREAGKKREKRGKKKKKEGKKDLT